MATPLALILRAPGTNCDVETEFAFAQAGARTQRVHLVQLFQEKSLLADAQIICLPGGFSYGDDIAAGRIFARQLTDQLGDALQQFRARGGLILGICNGFQVLLQLPYVLMANDRPSATVTLAENQTGTFEARWVHLEVVATEGPFTRGLRKLYLPIAHAEGRLAVTVQQDVEQLVRDRRIAFRYTSANGSVAQGQRDNPNGSVADIAGLQDASGQVLGLMPHPERYVHRLQHPRWTRGEGAEPGDGHYLFSNAVTYFSDR